MGMMNKSIAERARDLSGLVGFTGKSSSRRHRIQASRVRREFTARPSGILRNHSKDQNFVEGQDFLVGTGRYNVLKFDP